MNTFKKILPWFIRIIIAILFIVSAVAKMYPSPYFAISTFEVKQLYPLGFSDVLAPWFSRILIGIELALGILILQNNYLKKLIIPVTILLLAIFVAHLSYVTFATGGDSGNCGCFGELIPMTPIEAIIKNIIAIFLLAVLWFLIPKSVVKNNFWIVGLITLATILTIFIIAPIKKVTNDFMVTSESEIIADTIIESKENAFIKDSTTVSKVIKDTLNKEKTVANDEVILTTEPKKIKSGYAKLFKNIDSGRKTLCFFVPGCDHCRTAAKELTELKQKDPNFPEIAIIFMNEEVDLIPAFFKEAGAEYPYKVIEIIPFWNALGTGKDTPGIKYLWNGNAYKYYNGIGDNKFDPADYKTLINKTFLELNNK